MAPRYDDKGRRDPFLNPSASIKKPPPSGLAGFDIDAFSLQGIVKTSDGFTAMVEGPDGKTYFVRKGDVFYNGSVVAIDHSAVVFLANETNPLIGLTTRRVRLALHAAD